MATNRGRQSTRDMVLSMLVLVVLVGALAAFVAAVRGTPDPVREVDAEAAIATLSDGLPFAALAPPQTPEGWRATRADLQPGDPLTWRLGYVTDDEEFVGLTQSNADVADVARSDLPGYEADGTTVLDGTTWTRYRQTDEGDPDLALLSEWDVGGPSVALVVGSGTDGQVEQFASSLEPVR